MTRKTLVFVAFFAVAFGAFFGGYEYGRWHTERRIEAAFDDAMREGAAELERGLRELETMQPFVFPSELVAP